MLLLLFTLSNIWAVCSVQLRCLNESTYLLENKVFVVSHQLSQFGFEPSFPHAYDAEGARRSVPHMWASSNVTYACSFRMNDFRISSVGKILDESNRQVHFGDPTMSGPYGPVYTKNMFSDWNAYHEKKTALETFPPTKYGLVVPLRMPWDDCFNHMSFEMMPLAGAVLELHGDIWNTLTWHTSTYSAAMINAMGVPMDRIIIEKPVVAETLLLPWIPHWLPVQLAPVRGIAKRACELFTKTLIAMKFESTAALNPLPVNSTTHPNDTADDIINSYNATDGMRYVVYITRAGQDCRDVYNEAALLSMLTEIVDPSKVKVVVVGHSHAYPSVTALQQSWQRFAKIFSRAIVMLGPHGGAWNNIMFTPPDCHYVEFNYLPDDPVYVPGTIQVRQCTLNAYWAKGGSGKFYNLEANNRTNHQRPPHLYEAGWMKLSIRDAARILLLINKDIPGGGILKMGVRADKYPHYLKSDLDVPYRKKKSQTPGGKVPPRVHKTNQHSQRSSSSRIQSSFNTSAAAMPTPDTPPAPIQRSSRSPRVQKSSPFRSGNGERSSRRSPKTNPEIPPVVYPNRDTIPAKRIPNTPSFKIISDTPPASPDPVSPFVLVKRDPPIARSQYPHHVKRSFNSLPVIPNPGTSHISSDPPISSGLLKPDSSSAKRGQFAARAVRSNLRTPSTVIITATPPRPPPGDTKPEAPPVQPNSPFPRAELVPLRVRPRERYSPYAKRFASKRTESEVE